MILIITLMLIILIIEIKTIKKSLKDFWGDFRRIVTYNYLSVRISTRTFILDHAPPPRSCWDRRPDLTRAD